MLLDKWIVKPQPSFQGTHRKGTKGPAFLPFARLCVTPYRRMLGALQTGASQNQRRNSQVISTRSPKKPTPNHKGKVVAAIVICTDPREDKEERPALLAAAITSL